MVTETRLNSRSSLNWVSGASDLVAGVLEPSAPIAARRSVSVNVLAFRASAGRRATVSRKPIEMSWKVQTGVFASGSGF